MDTQQLNCELEPIAEQSQFSKREEKSIGCLLENRKMQTKQSEKMDRSPLYLPKKCDHCCACSLRRLPVEIGKCQICPRLGKKCTYGLENSQDHTNHKQSHQSYDFSPFRAQQEPMKKPVSELHNLIRCSEIQNVSPILRQRISSGHASLAYSHFWVDTPQIVTVPQVFILPVTVSQDPTALSDVSTQGGETTYKYSKVRQKVKEATDFKEGTEFRKHEWHVETDRSTPKARKHLANLLERQEHGINFFNPEEPKGSNSTMYASGASHSQLPAQQINGLGKNMSLKDWEPLHPAQIHMMMKKFRRS